MSQICNATDAQFAEIDCGRNQASCNMCCVYHVCKHKWANKQVWKECSFFSNGNCSFTG